MKTKPSGVSAKSCRILINNRIAKKINMALVVLASLGASSAYANCPAAANVTIGTSNPQRFMGIDSQGVKWIEDPDTVHRRLNVASERVDTFQGASGEKDGDGGVVSMLTCSYLAAGKIPVDLVSPHNRYQLDVKLPTYWVRTAPGWEQANYICVRTSESDCPFSVIPDSNKPTS